MPRKHITNQEIARILRETALMYAAEGVAYKPQAYETAAKTVESLGEDLGVMYRKCGKQCIDDLPAIGEAMTEKIEELMKTGHLKRYEQMKKKYPFDLVGITAIEGVGPKKAVELYRLLKVKTVKALEKAARAGKIRELEGFGKRSEEKILEAIQFVEARSGRVLLSDALRFAEGITRQMREVDGVTHCDVTGSARRMQETVGDLDFIVTTTKPEKAREAFKQLPEVARVLEESREKVFVHFSFGMDGDLLVLKPKEYGAALLHFTGDKEHNIQIRTLAREKGWSLSEHGLMYGRTVLASETEEAIYKKLGLSFIPVELRTGAGEVELAKKGLIPTLLPYGSLKGDVQVQTKATDGTASIQEMAEAARKAGLSYIAITDHTQSLAMTGGLDEKGLAKQGREIDALNKNMKGFRILKSAEVNILKDGSLDINDAALKKLDVVSVAVHSHFGMSEVEMTERMIRAIKHPLVNIVFHPTGRKLNQRPGVVVDMAKIIRAAKQYRVTLEVNADPSRLDLRDAHVRMAVEAGVKLVVDSDAHAPEHFDYLPYGIAQARRGWATRADVLNTKQVDAFLRSIQKSGRA